MLALQIIAFALLVLSALLFVGPQIVAYGPRAIPAMMRQPEARFVGGCFASLIVMALIAPGFGAALMTGGETLQMVALELSGLSFGLI